MGWRYLAVWIDLYSQRVVTSAMASSIEASMVPDAQNRPLGQRQIEPDKLVIHSEEGRQ